MSYLANNIYKAPFIVTKSQFYNRPLCKMNTLRMHTYTRSSRYNTYVILTRAGFNKFICFCKRCFNISKYNNICDWLKRTIVIHIVQLKGFRNWNKIFSWNRNWRYKWNEFLVIRLLFHGLLCGYNAISTSTHHDHADGCSCVMLDDDGGGAQMDVAAYLLCPPD